MAVTLTINGVNRTGLVDLTSIVCTLPGANISGECSFVLDDTSRQVTLAARQTVVIADGATTLWRGLIAAFRAEVIAGGMRRYRVTARDYGILLDDDATINTTFAAGTTEQTVLTSILSGTGLTVTGDANSALASALTIQATSRRQAIEQLIEAIGATRYYWVNVSPALVYRATSLGAAPFVLVDGAPSAGQTDYESLAFDTDATASGTATTRGEAIVVGADGWQPGQTVTVNSTALGLTNATYYLASVGLEFHTDSVRRWRLGLGAPARLITTALASSPSLPPPRIASIAQFAASIRPPAVVASLPTLPNGLYPAGSIVYLTTDGKLYKTSDGTTWTTIVNLGELDGQITETQISDGAISTPKLAANAVTTDKLAAGAVTANGLAANSVVAGKVAAAAIGTNELAAGAVTADKVAVNSLVAGLWTGSPRNLLANPGFELPISTLGSGFPDQADWYASGGTLTRSQEAPRSGGWNGRHSNSSGSNGFAVSGRVPVSGGRRYQVRGWARGSSSQNSVNFTVTLRVRWFDASKAQISDVTVASAAIGTVNTYTQFANVLTAPTNAAFAFVFWINPGDTGGTGVIYLDDMEFHEADQDIDHAGGNVRIDSSGITIQNGKLTFVDNYGATAMDGGGFGDAWQDFINAGVYNGNFSRVAGNTAAGWTVTNGTFPINVVTGTGWGSGNALEYAASAASTTDSWVTSDFIASTGRQFLRLSSYWKVVSGTGQVQASVRAFWYDAGKAQLSFDGTAFTDVPDAWYIETDVLSPPAAARYVRFQVRLRCLSGAKTVRLYSCNMMMEGTPTGFVPPGLIAAWSGSQLPPGWMLCDGSNGTPDLRDRFIVGGNLAGGSTPAAGQSGGTVSPRSALPTHATHASGGSHTHTAGPTGSAAVPRGTGISDAAAHGHSHSTDSAGGHTHDAHSAHSVYQYYVLAWIMKA
jgi:hypothetical protein